MVLVGRAGYGGYIRMRFATKAAVVAMGLSIAGMSFCACSAEPEPVSSDVNVISTQNQNSGNTLPSGSIDANAESENFVFEYSGVKFIVNSALDVNSIPDDDYDVKPNASCAHQGMAYIYDLKGGSIELFTDQYPDSPDEVISVIMLLDDTVTTAEGIYIGNTVEQVKAAYGEPAEETSTLLIYTKGSSRLQFSIDENGTVTEIDYLAV